MWCSFRNIDARRSTPSCGGIFFGPVFRDLAEPKECTVEEGHLMPDHVHLMLPVPPQYAGSSVMGFIKGKSAIHIARV